MFHFDITKILNNFSLIFLFILPIAYIFSPPLINLSVLVIIVNFIYALIIAKNKSLFSDKLFIFLFIFWLYISIQSLFLENANFFKSFTFVRFIFLPFAICYLLKVNYDKISKLNLFYFIILALVIMDLFFQYLTGIDILGYRVELINGYDASSDNWRDLQIQRFSGPFGYEIRAGTFILFFGIICISLYSNFYKKKNFFLQSFSFFILIVSVIITGDRAPLVTLFITFLMYILFSKFQLKYYLSIFVTSILLFSLFLSFSKTTNFRYIENAKILMSSTNEVGQKSQIVKTLKDNPWSAHYLTAYEIFKSSVFFGKGIKSFRIECEKYPNIDSAYSHSRCSTHPHNVFMEVISETGLVGLFLLCSALAIYIKRYYNTSISFDNIAFFFLLAMLLPIKPSGALFSTWFGSLIWILMGFSMLKKD
tara:strand:+ start:959 stop:2227 length:1269 start_codon:yes stop_codon:yes gene_type:complete